MEANLKVIISLNKFKNIDLFQQGLYNLQIRMCYCNEDKQVYCIPRQVKEDETPVSHFKAKSYMQQDFTQTQLSLTDVIRTNNNHANNMNLLQQNHWLASHILAKEKAFVSKTFLIRFCEEEANLNNLCEFNAQVPIDLMKRGKKQQSKQPQDADILKFEIRLMFSELHNASQNQNNKTGMFRCLSTFSFQLTDVLHGCHQYLPVTFDNKHFCYIKTTIHVMMTSIHYDQEAYSNLCNAKKASFFDFFRNEPKQQVPFCEFLTDMSHSFVNAKIDKIYFFLTNLMRNSFKILNYSLKQFLFEQTLKNKDNHQNYIDLQLPIPLYFSKQYNLLNKQQDCQNFPSVNNVQNYSNYNNKKEQSATTPSQLFMLLEKSQQYELSECLQSELTEIQAYIDKQIISLIHALKLSPKTITQTLKTEYMQRIKDVYNKQISTRTIQTADLSICLIDFPILAQQMIKSVQLFDFDKYQQNESEKRVEDEELVLQQIKIIKRQENPCLTPVISQEIFINTNRKDIVQNSIQLTNSNSTSSSIVTISQQMNLKFNKHIIFLVHGFQGSSLDMQTLKNNIELVHSHVSVVCCTSNEGRSELSIQLQGENLAKEILQYCVDLQHNQHFLKISFIGHSLGGLVIRSALSLLAPLKHNMHAFVSLATPHLGYMFNQSSLFDVGMWLMSKWKDSDCLKQLTMSDAKEAQNCYLYRLAKQEGLKWFEQIVFVSSKQDKYVPYQSARIQQLSRSDTRRNTPEGTIYNKMAFDLMMHLKCKEVHRLNVDFQITQSNFDNFIGRASHVMFLDNQIFMNMFAHYFQHIFI